MNYQEALAFHENAKQYGSILGLDTIRNLMKELKDIWKELKIVHIAGTNGKGSVCCFLASVLQEAGYCVGQFNSPAVFDLREVYQINGNWIEEAEYAVCMKEVADACDRMVSKGMPHPTVFEVETALAFLWFYRKNCEIVLLETGMGGSTDATNLIEKPLCSVLTSIGMDHMEYLGNTIEEIARIKAGIMKEKCPVITVKQSTEVENVLCSQAKEKGSPYYQAAEIHVYKTEINKIRYMHPVLGEIILSMRGSYQIENSALAIETLLILREQGYVIEDTQITKGLKKAKWSGRFECICDKPYLIIDGAHNADAALKLKESILQNYPDSRRIAIMGVMADKPYKEMLKILLPLFDKVYTVTPNNPRALPARILAEEVRKQGGIGIDAKSVEWAVDVACWESIKSKEETILVVFGSLYYLGEVKEVIKRRLS